jgi:hypothetical protein
MIQVRSNRWRLGFLALPAELPRTGRNRWDAANRAFYDASQDFAHVRTGVMKRSGHYETTASGLEVTATLTYDSAHAIYEEARGGDHAFISRAWELTEQRFGAALPEMFAEVVMTWR